MVRPVFSDDFEIPAPGTYLVSVEEVDFADTEKGTTSKVKFKIMEGLDGNEEEGKFIWSFYNIYLDFVLEKFLGLLVKAINMPSDKDYPLSYFDDMSKREKVRRELPGAVLAVTIKHRTLPDGTKGVKVSAVYSADEFENMKKTRQTTEATTTPESEAKAEPQSQGGGSDSVASDW